MVYRHQTPDLKAPLTKDEITHYTRVLRAEFTFRQSTSYWKPDGEEWKKEVSRARYHVHPVEGGFGLIVSLSEAGKDRLFTVYPRLQLAVLDQLLTIGCGNHNGAAWATKKLEKLGYRVTQEKSYGWIYSGDKTRKAFPIAAEVSGCFRGSDILERVIKNLDAIVQSRPESEYCEVVVFTPPGDGGRNSPVGRTAEEISYGWPRLNIGREILVPIVGGKVGVNEIAQIFGTLNARETIGVSSRRLPPVNARNGALEDLIQWGAIQGGYHAPMVDFRCATPEEAIHTLERLNIKVTGRNVILIDSGNSFHAHLPSQILKCGEADKFLDELKTQEEVCDKWVPLQKEQRYQLLRVAPCLQKTRLPVVLDL